MHFPDIPDQLDADQTRTGTLQSPPCCPVLATIAVVSSYDQTASSQTSRPSPLTGYLVQTGLKVQLFGIQGSAPDMLDII